MDTAGRSKASVKGSIPFVGTMLKVKILLFINSFLMLLTAFQAGFMWNAVVRRLDEKPQPSDTNLVIFLLCLSLCMFIPLLIGRFQYLRIKDELSKSSM